MSHTAKVIALANRQIVWLRDMILAQEEIIRLEFESITPSEMTVTLIGERNTPLMDFLKFKIGFPAIEPGTDVVSQVFQMVVNGAPTMQETYGRDVASVEVEVPEDATVDLSMVHVDNKGNQSPAKEQSFVAQDTLTPDAPGDFGAIELISERHEDDAPAPTE